MTPETRFLPHSVSPEELGLPTLVPQRRHRNHGHWKTERAVLLPWSRQLSQAGEAGLSALAWGNGATTVVRLQARGIAYAKEHLVADDPNPRDRIWRVSTSTGLTFVRSAVRRSLAWSARRRNTSRNSSRCTTSSPTRTRSDRCLAEAGRPRTRLRCCPMIGRYSRASTPTYAVAAPPRGSECRWHGRVASR